MRGGRDGSQVRDRLGSRVGPYGLPPPHLMHPSQVTFSAHGNPTSTPH